MSCLDRWYRVRPAGIMPSRAVLYHVRSVGLRPSVSCFKTVGIVYVPKVCYISRRDCCAGICCSSSVSCARINLVGVACWSRRSSVLMCHPWVHSLTKSLTGDYFHDFLRYHVLVSTLALLITERLRRVCLIGFSIQQQNLKSKNIPSRPPVGYFSNQRECIFLFIMISSSLLGFVFSVKTIMVALFG